MSNGVVKVLVVDDDPLINKNVKRILENDKNMTYKVQCAENGRSALNILKNEEVDIALVDVYMPEMDGVELLRIMKAADTGEVPMIMMSSSEDPETAKECILGGAEDFLQKPIQPNVLLRRVEVFVSDRVRKKQESVYLEALEREKEKTTELKTRVEEKESEIAKIHGVYTTAIETPLQTVVQTIWDLLTGDYAVSHIKQRLFAVMRSLGTSDMYRPAIASFVQQRCSDGERRADSFENYLSYEFATAPALDESARKQSIIDGVKMPRGVSIVGSASPEESGRSEDSDEVVPNVSLDELKSFGFNVLDYSEEEVISIVVMMFDSLNLIERWNIDKKVLREFLKEVHKRYNKNPYHGFYHAMDVTQFIYAILKNAEVRIHQTLKDIDVLTVMISAVIHDVDHPGVNNNFHVRLGSELAILYNVLENHHLATAFSIMQDKSKNPLSSLSSSEYVECRRGMISTVLATDMANHFEIIGKFNTKTTSAPISKENKDDRMLLLKILMKCADINNSARPWNVYSLWVEKLLVEFFEQGDLEGKLGMDISPFMDRKNTDKAEMQVGFLDFVAGPLFTQLLAEFPMLSELDRNMKDNREPWKSGKMDEKKKKDDDFSVVVEESSTNPLFDMGMALEHVDDDPEFLGELLELFMQTTPSKFDSMERSFKKFDWVTLHREAHTIKGTSHTLGCIPLRDVSQILTNLAKDKKEDMIPNGIKSVREAFDKVLPILQQVVKDVGQ